jgi:hypothetical protein
MIGPRCRGCHLIEKLYSSASMATFKIFAVSKIWQLAIFFFLILSGCAAKTVLLDHAVVRNDTAGIISDVQVVHEPTGKTGAINMILPQKSFELGFAGQPMRAKRAIITWNDDEGHRRKSAVALPAKPDVSKEEQSYSLIYSIQPAGVVLVKLENSNRK